MEILFKNEDVAVVYKEPGLPSQPDQSGDIDAMTRAAQELHSIGERDTLYLVHRLDRVVGGVMLFARNKAAAARFSALVSGEGIGKEYLAVIDGSLDSGELCDYLYKDTRVGKSFVVDRARGGVKLAELKFLKISSVETDRGIKSLVKIKLKTGRFHQIRAQFSSRGVPICGDGKYGSRDNRANMPALFAYKLSLDSDGISVRKLPDTNAYPWCLFDKDIWRTLDD